MAGLGGGEGAESSLSFPVTWYNFKNRERALGCVAL